MSGKNYIALCHDAIPYSWKYVPDEKYENWLRITRKGLNITDFTASGFPFMLQIEPTNMCNLSCPLCPKGRDELERSNRNMSLKEFKSIIDDMEPYLLFLVLWDWGDPFINPDFPDMIRYASERDIKSVTSTNAHFLYNDAYIENILTSGLSTLIVAIDSLHEEGYRVYRKKGNIHRVITGLKNLLKLKKQLGSKTLINMRMVIMKHNEKELQGMRRLAQELDIDRFSVKTVYPGHISDTTDKEIVPKNPKYRRYKYKKGTYERIRINTHCKRIWQMSNIFSNGDVVPCCYDYNSKLKVGNILEEPFSRIWNSPAYQKLRKRIYYHKDSIDKCRKCTINYKLFRTGWFVEPREFDINSKIFFKNKIRNLLNMTITQRFINSIKGS